MCDGDVVSWLLARRSALSITLDSENAVHAPTIPWFLIGPSVPTVRWSIRFGQARSPPPATVPPVAPAPPPAAVFGVGAGDGGGGAAGGVGGAPGAGGRMTCLASAALIM